MSDRNQRGVMKLTTAAWERAHGKPPRNNNNVYGGWWLQACTDADARNLIGAPLCYTGTLDEALRLARFRWPDARWVAVLP